GPARNANHRYLQVGCVQRTVVAAGFSLRRDVIRRRLKPAATTCESKTDGSLADVKRADVAAAAIAGAPDLAEPLAAEGVLDDAGRACLDFGGQRRVERKFVAANLVVIAVEAARLHLGDAGVQLEAGVLLARAAVDADRLGMNLDDVLEQLAPLLLGEADQ